MSSDFPKSATGFSYGFGKMTTICAKALEQSHRTLAKDFGTTASAFASASAFADPEWVLVEFIAQRDELLASWQETVGFRTGFMNPYAALKNAMN